jgi:hypothetical protein
MTSFRESLAASPPSRRREGARHLALGAGRWGTASPPPPPATVAVLLALAAACYGVSLQSPSWMESRKKDDVSHAGLWTWCAPGEKSLDLEYPCSTLDYVGATKMFRIFGAAAPEEKARLLVASQVLAVVAFSCAIAGAGLSLSGGSASKLSFMPALASFVTSLLAVIFYANLFASFAHGLNWSAWPGQALDRSEVRTSLTTGWIAQLLGCITAGLSTFISLIAVSISVAPSFTKVTNEVPNAEGHAIKGATEPTGETTGERERETTTARRRMGTGTAQ